MMMMMMMMMREVNRTRDAMIELSPPPPQKTDTNTRVESAQQQQKEQKRTHTMTVRLLIVFSRGRCICNISADLIKNHTTSKRLFCTVLFKCSTKSQACACCSPSIAVSLQFRLSERFRF